MGGPMGPYESIFFGGMVSLSTSTMLITAVAVVHEPQRGTLQSGLSQYQCDMLRI